MTFFAHLRLSLATLACLLAGHAVAQSHTWAWAPGSAKDHRSQALRASKGQVPAGKVRLPRPEPAALARVKAANSGPAPKRVQIGVGRALNDSFATEILTPDWRQIESGWVAQWEVATTDAVAVRVALSATRLPTGAEIRFTETGGTGEVHGPFSAAEMLSQERYWSPVIEGDGVLVEIFLPGEALPGAAEVTLVEVAHLFASPRSGKLGTVVDNSGECEQDIICRTPTDAALAQAARAVAAMVFTEGAASYICTGTLLNGKDGALAPYFYTANHCIGTAATAATLTTHWFFERAGCDTGATSTAYRQVSGGAVLLHANTASDAAFLRLNSPPPAGAVYAAWDAALVASGSALVGVHHPVGDWKKASLGSSYGFSALGPGFPSGSFVVARWTTGVTEPGSSGSGIFTATGGEYRLRGGLWGGASACSAPTAADYYSRLDQVYPAIAKWLDPPPIPTCSHTVSPVSFSTASAATVGNGTVATTANCPWTAVSNASWIAATGSGTNAGSFAYSIAANTGPARTGTVTVAGATFTVIQSAPGEPPPEPEGVPSLSISKTSLDFGGQSMGTSSALTEVVLSNSGGGVLTVLTVIGSGPPFTSSNNCIQLTAGQACSINVMFSPAVATAALNGSLPLAGSLTISSNVDGSPHAILLGGQAEKSLVTHYYRAILHRSPDSGGKAFWEGEAARMQALGSNVNETWYSMAMSFFFSAEYLSLGRNDAGFVSDLYRTFFNRAGDSAGIAYWSGLLASGMPREVVLVSFIFSPEFENFAKGIFGDTAARAEVDAAGDFYRGLLARLPDSGGNGYWLARFRAAQCKGGPDVYAEVEAISSGFLGSAEYTNRARSNAQFVGDMYNAFLRRGGDAAGVQYWISQLATGARTRDNVRQAFITTPEFNARVRSVIAQGCF